MFRFDYGDCDTSNSFELFHYRIFPGLLSSGKFSKKIILVNFWRFIFDLLCEVGKVSKIRQIEIFIELMKTVVNKVN